MRIAVVGAGVTGLSLARTLVGAGAEVVVFDRGRRVGGRLATRDQAQGGFDSGLQRFTARGPAFRSAVAAWEAAGWIARTESASAGATEAPWWLPVPSAEALAQGLSEGLRVECSAVVQGLRRGSGAWSLSIEGQRDWRRFDQVLLTAPAPQSAAILGRQEVFGERLAQAAYQPTWALMLLAPVDQVAWPSAIFTRPAPEGAVALIVREGLKPGRRPDGAQVRLLVHAGSKFSAQHLDAGPAEVEARLLEALRGQPGWSGLRPGFVQVQRWRYAKAEGPFGPPALYDPKLGLGVAGDGFLGPRLEAAFDSARALAEQVLGT